MQRHPGDGAVARLQGSSQPRGGVEGSLKAWQAGAQAGNTGARAGTAAPCQGTLWAAARADSRTTWPWCRPRARPTPATSLTGTTCLQRRCRAAPRRRRAAHPRAVQEATGHREGLRVLQGDTAPHRQHELVHTVAPACGVAGACSIRVCLRREVGRQAYNVAQTGLLGMMTNGRAVSLYADWPPPG